MIIFGFRGMAKALAIVTFVCGHCGNPAAQRLVQYTRWFTLFFIPVFPVSRKRVVTCTYCGHAARVTKEQADAMVAGASGQGPAPIGPAAEQLPTAPPQPPVS